MMAYSKDVFGPYLPSLRNPVLTSRHLSKYNWVHSTGHADLVELEDGISFYVDFERIKKVDKKNSLWDGECFVFDQRVCLTDELEIGSYEMCFACRMPITEKEMQNEKYIEGISCIYCYDKTTKEKKERFKSRQKQILLAKNRGEKHLGGRQIR